MPDKKHIILIDDDFGDNFAKKAAKFSLENGINIVIVPPSAADVVKQLEQWKAQGITADLIDTDLNFRNSGDGLDVIAAVHKWGESYPDYASKKLLIHTKGDAKRTEESIRKQAQGEVRKQAQREALEAVKLLNSGQLSIYHTDELYSVFGEYGGPTRQPSPNGLHDYFQKKVLIKIPEIKVEEQTNPVDQLLNPAASYEEIILAINSDKFKSLFIPEISSSATISSFRVNNEMSASGYLAYTSEEVDQLRAAGKDPILVLREYHPKMIAHLNHVAGVIMLGTDDGHLRLDCNNHQKAMVGELTEKNAAFDLPFGHPVTIGAHDGVVFHELVTTPPLDLSNQAWVKHFNDATKLIAKRHRVAKIEANISNCEQFRVAREHGVTAIGLLRTERMLLEEGRLPILQAALTEQDPAKKAAALQQIEMLQTQDLKEIYQEAYTITQYADGPEKTWVPVKVRLLDARPNQFLSSEQLVMLPQQQALHGAELATVTPEIYMAQARAIFSAAQKAQYPAAHLQIMIPNVKTAQELEFVKTVIDGVAKDFGCQGIYKFGAMIETKEAVTNAGEIAKLCDFLSFGTGDLTSAITGVERGNTAAAQAWMDAHGDPNCNMWLQLIDPVVASMKETIIKAAIKNPGIKFSLCGEQAADPQSIKICSELGISSLSVPSSPQHIYGAQLAASKAGLEFSKSESHSFFEQAKIVEEIIKQKQYVDRGYQDPDKVQMLRADLGVKHFRELEEIKNDVSKQRLALLNTYRTTIDVNPFHISVESKETGILLAKEMDAKGIKIYKLFNTGQHGWRLTLSLDEIAAVGLSAESLEISIAGGPDLMLNAVKGSGPTAQSDPHTNLVRSPLLSTILSSIDTPENFIGGGDEAKVYKLEGYDNLVIRVTDPEVVKDTKSLTQANDIYEGSNLGQEVFKGRGFTINLKQDGVAPKVIIEPLIKHYRDSGSSFPGTLAMADYWEKMASLPPESYVNLLEDMNKATKAGRMIDPNRCNYLVDFNQEPPKIGWVDVGEKRSRESSNYVDNVKYAIFNGTTSFTTYVSSQEEYEYKRARYFKDSEALDLKQRVDNAIAVIRAKIEDAGIKTGTPFKAEDMPAYEHKIGAKNSEFYNENSKVIAADSEVGLLHQHINVAPGNAKSSPATALDIDQNPTNHTAEYRTGSKEGMTRSKRGGIPVVNTFGASNDDPEFYLANKPIEKVKAAEAKVNQQNKNNVDEQTNSVSRQLATDALLNVALTDAMPNGQTTSVQVAAASSAGAPVVETPAKLIQVDAAGKSDGALHVESGGAIAPVNPAVGDGIHGMPPVDAVSGASAVKPAHSADAPSVQRAPAPHNTAFGSAMSLSGLIGTIEQYKQNGFAPEYAVSVSASALSLVDDIAENKLLGRPKLAGGKLPYMVGFIPDLINLAAAKNDDQRNLALTNLTVGGTTMALLSTSYLAGPIVGLGVIAANYVGERTLAPLLKMADGWMSKDSDKIEIGETRLHAGISELKYKLGGAGGIPGLPSFGNVSLGGDFVSGVGGIITSTGGLLNDGMFALAEKVTGEKIDPASREVMKESMKYLPGGDTFQMFDALGSGLSWLGNKITVTADWAADVTGLGSADRKAAETLGKQADAMQKKYDEAHKRKIVPPPELVSLNAHNEAYSKAANELMELLSKKETVKLSVLEKAYAAYETSYQALVSDKMYQGAEDMSRLRMVNPMNKPAVDGTYRAAQTIEERKIRNQQADAERHAFELFLQNPITPKYRTDTETLHQQVVSWVDAKRRERQGEIAQSSYEGLAKGFNTAGETLETLEKSIAGTVVQLGALKETIARDMEKQEKTEPAIYAAAQKHLEELSASYLQLEKELGALDASIATMEKKHKNYLATNPVYRDSKEAASMTQMLTTMRQASKELHKGMDEVDVKEINGQLATLVSMNVPAAVVAVHEPNNKAVQAANNEAVLTALIVQNPVFAKNAELLTQVQAEANKLVTYYKHGVDETGKDISNGNASLKDDKLDDKEFRAAIVAISAKFKENGITLSTPDATNFIAQNKPNNIQR